MMIASSDFLLRGRPGLRRTSPATSLELPFMSCSEHRNNSRPNYLTALGLSASDRTLRCAGSDHAVPSLGALQYCGYPIREKWPMVCAPQAPSAGAAGKNHAFCPGRVASGLRSDVRINCHRQFMPMNNPANKHRVNRRTGAPWPALPPSKRRRASRSPRRLGCKGSPHGPVHQHNAYR